MELLYLTDRLSHRGGAPHHLLDLIRVMAEEHQVTVAAADKDQDVVLPEGVRFERCSGLRHARAHRGGLDKLPSLIARAGVIHVQNIMNPVALSLACGPRAVVTVQDHRVFCPGPGKTLLDDVACDQPMSEEHCTFCIPDDDRRLDMLALTRARLDAIRAAAQTIVLSQYMADALTQVGAPGAAVIPPPVHVDTVKTDAGEHFLLAGRLVKHKGTDIAIEAFSLARPPCELRVAGLGSESIGSARALGWLDRDTLRTELRSSRALLFPTRWQEPFGIVGVEALSVGTPVIAMSRGGMDEWTDAGTIVVDDAAEMAAAITHLSQRPQAALALGEAGHAMVAERFSPARHRSAIKAVYNAL